MDLSFIWNSLDINCFRGEQIIWNSWDQIKILVLFIFISNIIFGKSAVDTNDIYNINININYIKILNL